MTLLLHLVKLKCADPKVLGTHCRETLPRVRQETQENVHCSVTCGSEKCPPTEDVINTFGYIHISEHDIAVKVNDLHLRTAA